MKTMRIVFMAFIAASMLLLPGFLTREGHCRRNAEAREIFAEVNDLRREINLINLVNGLYLSAGQMNQMLAILRKVEATRGEYKTKATSQAHEMEEILTKIRETVARDEEIGEDLAREFHQVKKKGQGLREQFHGSMRPYQDEIKGILNENQLALINDFKPCVVPSHDVRNPVRIGQASGDTRMSERLLTRVRQMDERAYMGRKSFMIGRHIERVERHVGVLSDEERAEEESRVTDIFKRARELSDVDFDVQKGDLARELKELYKKALQSRHRKRRGDLDKLGRFLLDPKLIPILEKRLTRLSAR